MSKFPYNPQGFDPRRVVVVRPRKRHKRQRFRWEIVWVALTLLGAAWLLQNIECNPSMGWERVMDALHVQNRQRYTQMACWGVVLCGIAAIVRILRSQEDEE